MKGIGSRGFCSTSLTPAVTAATTVRPACGLASAKTGICTVSGWARVAWIAPTASASSSRSTRTRPGGRRLSSPAKESPFWTTRSAKRGAWKTWISSVAVAGSAHSASTSQATLRRRVGGGLGVSRTTGSAGAAGPWRPSTGAGVWTSCGALLIRPQPSRSGRRRSHRSALSRGPRRALFIGSLLARPPAGFRPAGASPRPGTAPRGPYRPEPGESAERRGAAAPGACAAVKRPNSSARNSTNTRTRAERRPARW